MAVNQSINVEARDYVTQSMSVLAAHAADKAREMLHAGVTEGEILTMLVDAAEDIAGRGSAVCSILVLEKQGLLRNAASPHLPADYLAAIDRLKPSPSVGTCAAAAATGSVVVTCDFQADDSGLNFAICLSRLGLLARGVSQNLVLKERKRPKTISGYGRIV